jgi:hypothetical protein
MEGINLIGSTMKERFAREDKPGVLSYHGFDAWWNGGLRSAPAFHNMHGILTETALYSYATPKTYKPNELPERFTNGIPTKEPTVFYQRPWMGGKWGVRQAIEYMLTADFAILDLASVRREDFLHKAWEMARAGIEAGERGKPFAYVVPEDQPDRYSAEEMLRRLQLSGIEIRRSSAAFTARGKSYAAGTWVVPAGQPFRAHVMDLFEPQKYPELRAGTTGPTKRPYDVAGWTLTMLMGVQAQRIDEPFEAEMTGAAGIPARDPSLDHRDNSSFLATADLLARKVPVRWAGDGSILRSDDSGFGSAAYELKRPKVALYEPFTANMDTGWTQWVLDTFKVPYSIVRNSDLQKGNLRAQFDTLILASQSTASILHGFRDGESSSRGATAATGQVISIQRPEFTGGIGIAGLAQVNQFVREGGTLIALDDATNLPVQMFPLSVRPLIGSREGGEASSPTGYYSPGSLLRVTVDNTHPVAFGMPKEAIVFSSGGQAWELTVLPEFNKGDREIRSVARYATGDLLASGWVSGERTVVGRHILLDARYGKGRAVLFGFRPQFRGQSWGTFKFLLNAIYLGSAQRL